MRHRLFTLVFFLAGFTAAAQTTDTLSRYTEYFRGQAQQYQRWLDQTGLGRTLHVEEVEVRGDSMVILYLGFNTANTDTVFARWDQIRADFKKSGAGTTLEHALFNQMTYYLEINPRQAQVRLFDTYNLDSVACFKTRIYFQRDSIKTAESRCKNEVRTVDVRSTDLSAAKKRMSTAEFKKRNGKKVIFEKLVPFLQRRYERQQCDLRHPRFNLHGSSEELHFVVTDLCKEVLTDESNPWWCDALKSWACSTCKNCIKRERLDVHIFYEETTTGFRLKTDIGAAYGSGWYDKPRDNGYHDLQLDYPQYLKAYADKLTKEIFDFLTRP